MKFFALGVLFSGLAFSESKITVSGISSGAYMAQQFHTAFSSQVSGAGIVAGGPYYCAQGRSIDALNRCMKTYFGLPQMKDSVHQTKFLEHSGKIDAVVNLSRSKVYVISGLNDETVFQKVTDVLVETYKHWGANVIYENTLALGHAFPTDNFGNACKVPGKSPFISNCGFDGTGEILKHLIGDLFPKIPAKADRFFSFKQSEISMHQNGYAYIPEGCEFPDAGGCHIHVAFHGCKQTLDDIGLTFVTKTGYNSWAEANRIVVIYPQAIKNIFLNPNGCWDWWGYTGPDYHTKDGRQMKQVARLVEAFRNGKLQLKKRIFKDQ